MEAEVSSIVISRMTFEEARKCADEVKVGMFNIGKKLLELYEGDGWEVLGYTSWRECAQIEFGFKQSRVYQLLEAAQVERNISTIVEMPNNVSESVLRPLTKLEPEQQREVYQKAVETAPNGKVTAAHVENVARTFVAPPAATVRLEPRPADNYAPPSGYRFVPAVAPEESAEVFPETSNHMAIHYSSETPEHYTPKEIIDAAVALLGAIDLDPCSNSKGRPNVPAFEHFTTVDDGLSLPWFGRVYMNPPYGRVIGDWTGKLIDEYESGNVTEAIALVPGRIDTQWWQAMGRYPACFVTGRLTFIGNDDPAPFPSTVFYFGKNMSRFCEVFSYLGQIWARVNEAHHDL